MRPLKSQVNQELKTLSKQNLTLVDSWFQMPDVSWVESRKKNSGVMVAPDGEVIFKPIHIQEKGADGTKHDVELQVQVCKNKNLLEQYYSLRQEVYRSQLGFEGYDGGENEYDEKGDIVVVLRGNKVIAGARVNFSNKTKFMYNDLPEKGFLYRDILKRFDNSFNPETDFFTEICALAVNLKIADKTLFFKFFSSLLDYSEALGYKYSSGIAYEMLCRYYEIILKKLGRNFKIFYDTKYPVNFNQSQYGYNKFNLKFNPLVAKF